MKNRKYYFAYYSWAGDAMPQMWVEEDGIPIGGRRIDIVQGPYEITEDEFNGTLLNLEKKYPLTIDMKDILSKE